MGNKDIERASLKERSPLEENKHVRAEGFGENQIYKTVTKIFDKKVPQDKGEWSNKDRFRSLFSTFYEVHGDSWMFGETKAIYKQAIEFETVNMRDKFLIRYVTSQRISKDKFGSREAVELYLRFTEWYIRRATGKLKLNHLSNVHQGTFGECIKLAKRHNEKVRHYKEIYSKELRVFRRAAGQEVPSKLFDQMMEFAIYLSA
ncbi:hypothetical protein BN7_2870 [Wickerhamomyces ciferrii]|uniref:Uncharacterized protein n=1 Tax=Wickerhamomyces ciferrii (strain ATCC 14091 / BCRC 22168 / CBS 111 / JCM 3599 / NBRC 0793 / NRRL Y-1031 F-60-10) TaxID=1206466 RepID=K0KMA7_WICCF|nr:uncharacterized protein BN7_2870 [Wickerhamomyces ciferrii]CCH43322.1 hypothetical protein BN7_2870 [Wickerhamomyces ciferrii]